MNCEYETIIQVYKMNKYIEEITSKACHQLKINHLELMIIGLSSIDKMNVSKLSQELKVSKSAISQALVCLQLKRLITRQQVEENKKSFIIVPTEKAIQVCKDIFKVHKEQAKLLKEEIPMTNIINRYNINTTIIVILFPIIIIPPLKLIFLLMFRF